MIGLAEDLDRALFPVVPDDNAEIGCCWSGGKESRILPRSF